MPRARISRFRFASRTCSRARAAPIS
jgi:hypothetical protein